MLSVYAPEVNSFHNNPRKSGVKRLPKPSRRPVPKGNPSECREWTYAATEGAYVWAGRSYLTALEWIAAGCDPSDTLKAEAAEFYAMKPRDRSLAAWIVTFEANAWHSNATRLRIHGITDSNRKRFDWLRRAARLAGWAGLEGSDFVCDAVHTWADRRALAERRDAESEVSRN